MTTEEKTIVKDDGGRKWIGNVPPANDIYKSNATEQKEQVKEPEWEPPFKDNPTANYEAAPSSEQEVEIPTCPTPDPDLCVKCEDTMENLQCASSCDVVKSEPETSPGPGKPDVYDDNLSDERGHIAKLIRMYGVKKVRSYMEVKMTVLQLNITVDNVVENQSKIMWLSEAISRLSDKKLL